MIRRRLKRGIRNLAARALGMEEQVRARKTSQARSSADGRVPEAALPPTQPGTGDTPGPNSKEAISQAWAAAQLASGVSPFFLDVRSRRSWRDSRIPGAAHATPQAAQAGQLPLPDKGRCLVVYDERGDAESGAVAASLRAQGWSGARWLQGGIREWKQNQEPLDSEPC